MIFAVVFQLVPIMLLVERKLLGRFQHRYGPNRVGPVRDRCSRWPTSASSSSRSSSARARSIGWLFAIAPAISMMTAVATVAIIPFSDTVDIFGTQVGLYGIDPSIGILFAFAFGGIAFYGLMLGGWASGSKYSFLGSMRAAAQLISYEVVAGPRDRRRGHAGGLAVADGDRRHWQEGNVWFVIPQFVGFLDLRRRRLRGDQPPAVRPGRGRRRARRRLQHRVRRRALRRVLRRRVPEHGRRLRPHRDALPRRLEHPVRRSADLGRPDRRAREDDRLLLLLHLGARDAAAAALRPADVLRLEDPPAAGDPQCPRDRDPGGDPGDLRGAQATMSSPSSAAPPRWRAAAPTAPSARRCGA